MTSAARFQHAAGQSLQTESQFQAEIVRFAERAGWKVFHPVVSKRSKPGYPDLTMTRRERVLWAEVKRAQGRLSGDQEDWLAALSRVAEHSPNVEVHLWRPSDWSAIEDALR